MMTQSNGVLINQLTFFECSSFFFDTLMGTGNGSSSSSRLTLEATLESALITLDARPFVLLLVEFVISMLVLDDKGVAANGEIPS